MNRDVLVPEWLAKAGPERTLDEVKESLKRDFPEVLASLRKMAAQDPRFLQNLFEAQSPEDKPDVIQRLAARGRHVTCEQLDQLHEFAVSLFESLLSEDES
jgi:hypothetical protein